MLIQCQCQRWRDIPFPRLQVACTQREHCVLEMWSVFGDIWECVAKVSMRIELVKLGFRQSPVLRELKLLYIPRLKPLQSMPSREDIPELAGVQTLAHS